MLKKFSPKQEAALTWWMPQSEHFSRDAIICDGAVRSGKTLCMTLSFVFWATAFFNGKSFAICGKTIRSARRNIITPIIPELKKLGFSTSERVSENLITISCGGVSNNFYLFGGRDESSAAMIQGMTLGGAFFDEVALMPEGFVRQAMARCSLDGSRLWFNCNPESPAHWFYREWVLRPEQKNALYLHFTMDDNPSLSEKIKQKYRNLYDGVFFERFIEGKWVAAEGLVYPFFDREKHVCPPPERCEEYAVSCDYGTVNPMSMGLWGRAGECWYRISEYYYDSKRAGVQHTDEEYYAELERLCAEVHIQYIVVDPSAASFIECIKRHGKFNVIKAKNDVEYGIRKTAEALKCGKIRICEGCTDAIREFGMYRYSDLGDGEKPLKINDHAMDDIRYFAVSICDEPRNFYAFTIDREVNENEC